MYEGLFNPDPNFIYLWTLKAILRAKLHIKNNILFDQKREVVGILILFI